MKVETDYECEGQMSLFEWDWLEQYMNRPEYEDD